MSIYPIYLDNNATTPVAPEVRARIIDTLDKHFGNPSSKTHLFGWYAEELVELARESVARLINAQLKEVIFTSGATESINLAHLGFVDSFIKNKGTQVLNTSPTILTAPTEHRAVLESLEYLKTLGFKIKYLQLDNQGSISLEEYKRQFEENNIFFVSLMFANNEIGTIHEIKELVSIAHEYGAVFHCDATQAVGKVWLDVKDLAVDLLSFSAHKFYGPKGVGGLYLRASLLEGFSTLPTLTPLIYGGGHEFGYRAGTLNVPGIVGMGEAANISAKAIFHEKASIDEFAKIFLNNVQNEISEARLIGSDLSKRLLGNLNLYTGRQVSIIFAKLGHKIAFSASSACSSQDKKNSHVLRTIGMSDEEIACTIRIGIGRYNTLEEIECASKDLVRTIKEVN